MTEQNVFSDEILNAYIDGELGDDDARRLLEQLQHDAKLSARLAHLREVHDMLKMSYADVKPPIRCDNSVRWQRPHSLVAGLLLVVGVSIGWIASSSLPQDPMLQQVSQQPSADGVWRIVMHISTVDEYMQNALLEETETLLKTFEKNGQKAEVEIVASGAGLALLMTSRSNYAQRISSLQGKYTNLTFTACNRSMKRIAEIQDDEVDLLPNTHVAASGISEILKRQQEGWHYIRI
jgi:intracellular sulfur oxidation DsrE/DsrF family protein